MYFPINFHLKLKKFLIFLFLFILQTINLGILLFLYFIQLEPRMKKTKTTKVNTFCTFIGININVIICYYTQKTKFQTTVASNFWKKIKFFNFRSNTRMFFNMVINCLFSLTTSMKKRKKRYYCRIFLCGTTGYIPQFVEFFQTDKTKKKKNVTIQLIIKFAGIFYIYLSIMLHSVT